MSFLTRGGISKLQKNVIPLGSTKTLSSGTDNPRANVSYPPAKDWTNNRKPTPSATTAASAAAPQQRSNRRPSPRPSKRTDITTSHSGTVNPASTPA